MPQKNKKSSSRGNREWVMTVTMTGNASSFHGTPRHVACPIHHLRTPEADSRPNEKCFRKQNTLLKDGGIDEAWSIFLNETWTSMESPLEETHKTLQVGSRILSGQRPSSSFLTMCETSERGKKSSGIHETCDGRVTDGIDDISRVPPSIECFVILSSLVSFRRITRMGITFLPGIVRNIFSSKKKLDTSISSGTNAPRSGQQNFKG